VHDSGEAAGLLYYVMPYAEGETLRERLNREKQLPIEEGVRIAQDVAGALAFAHIQGVVHRDIKPENILLGGTNACVADFGIAKAIHSAGEARLTSTGLSAGTPAYMSPEQASGEREIDGRSDIYSLGCMLFEMLAGVPPYHGATAQAVLTRHMTEPPPRVRSFRSTVPAALERVLVRAMAKVPADRYTTAGEFGAALGAALSTPGEPARAASTRTKWLVGAGAALVAAGVLAFFILKGDPESEALADTVAVLPFDHGDVSDSLLDGDFCQVMLHDALARWQGLRLVNTYQLNDARAQRGVKHSTSESRFAMAREMGARRAVWGHVRNAEGAIEVRAAIYDIDRPRENAREYRVRLKRDGTDAAAMFVILADSLVARTVADGDMPPEGAMGTTSREALRAYSSGHKALNVWDVRRAGKEFGRAAELDPEYASAHLWQAQTMSWTSDRPDTWRAPARRAATLSARLAEREQALARGLLALAKEEYPAACEQFASLVKRDSSDFAAWFGLGDCHRNDRAVIRTGTPAQWRFRGSYHTAITAYREALERVPAAYLAFRQMAPGTLAKMMFTESNQLRRGFALAKDTIWFAAYPTLASDSLAFFPSLVSEHATQKVPLRASTDALNYTRGILKGIAEEWTRTFPLSAEAHATVAQILEASAQTAEALTTVRRARQLAVDAQPRLQAGITEVRLLLKLERFDAARSMSDSVLGWGIANEHETDLTAGLSALTGRIQRAAEQLKGAAQGYPFATSKGATLVPPKPLAELALSLAAYSAAGAPVAQIRSLADRIDRAIPSYYTDSRQQREARFALLVAPMSAAFPVLGNQVVPHLSADAGALEAMQLAFSRGEIAAVRARFDRVIARRNEMGIAPGSVSPDYTFQEAWLLLATGDTSGAAIHLDRSLNALPTMGSYAVIRVQEAAALVRAMALRAEIASARGERVIARRWAEAVSTLWLNADPELQPVVERMREISAK